MNNFENWQRDVDMWAGTILGLTVEDIDGGDLRGYFDSGIGAEAYVMLVMRDFDLDDIRCNGGWT